jgi:osmotically-inducible protein OsmY
VDVKGAGIDVAVNKGLVTLSGKVHNEHGKEKAEKLTKKIKGVTSVQNNLVVAESEK